MFAEDLKAQLKENHMKQNDLAEYLGVSKWTVSNWVHGKVAPRPRAFNMICDLFGMSREKYTAERNPKKVFTPKPYVRPEVKEKVDLSQNPYKRAEVKFDPPLEEPQRCDLAIKKLEADYTVMSERLETAIKRWKDAEEQITVLTREHDRLIDCHFEDRKRITAMEKRINEIDEINDKINYMRGLLDGSRPQELVSGVEEQKSWWKRLWE